MPAFLLTVFVGFVLILVGRRRVDPVAAYLGVWALAIGGTLVGVIHYEALPPEALLVLSVVTLALIAGYGLGLKLAVELPRIQSWGKDVWAALTPERYVILALLFLAKSLVLFAIQAHAGALSADPTGPTIVRGTQRSLFAVYLTYLSFGDLILAPIGGALVQRRGWWIRGMIPLVSLFVVSATLGGRTYIFWGATATLAGILYSYDAENVGQTIRTVLFLVGLGFVFAAVVESVRFLRSGGLPYATSLARIIPFSDFAGEKFSIVDSAVAVALYYWTSALAAFGNYISNLSQVSIHPFGWAVRGFINIYHINQLRDLVYVPVPTNVYTWLPYFYEDLGWLGFLVYPLGFGAVAGFSFGRLHEFGGWKYVVMSSLATVVLVFSPFDFALGNKAMYLAFLLALVL